MSEKPGVRPMTQDDYSEGHAVSQPPAPAASAAGGDHSTRDLVTAAVVGAVALWAVPKALDFVAAGGLADLFAGRDDDDGEELELEDQ